MRPTAYFFRNMITTSPQPRARFCEGTVHQQHLFRHTRLMPAKAAARINEIGAKIVFMLWCYNPQCYYT